VSEKVWSIIGTDKKCRSLIKMCFTCISRYTSLKWYVLGHKNVYVVVLTYSNFYEIKNFALWWNNCGFADLQLADWLTLEISGFAIFGLIKRN
jgi:hypothetical protein